MELFEGRRITRKAWGSESDRFHRPVVERPENALFFRPTRWGVVGVLLLIVGAVAGAIAAIGALY